MSEDRQRRLLGTRFQAWELLSTPLVFVDKSFNILHFNQSFRNILQCRDAVFPARELQEVFPGFLHAWFELGGMGDQTGILLSSQWEPSCSKYYDLHVSQISQESEHIEGYAVICTEVTERVLAHHKDKDLSGQYQTFLNLTQSSVVIHAAGIIRYCNDITASMFEFESVDEMIGLSVWPFVEEGSREVTMQRIREMIINNKPAGVIEVQFVKKNGVAFEVEVFSFPVLHEGEVAVKTFITDISHRKRTERQIIAVKEQYLNLVENITDIIFQTDNDANFTFLNRVWESYTGFQIDDTIGKSCFEFLNHPQNTSLFYTKVRRLLEYGIKEFQYDLLLSVKNGEPRFVQVSLKPLVDQKGLITGINGIMRDIHARKLADIEVRKIQKTLKHHQHTLASLTKEESMINGDFHGALKSISRVAAHTLDVSNVNIWKFSSDFSTLTCVINYDRQSDAYSSLQEFHINQFPAYFKLLINERFIISDDVQNDDRVIEFRDIYFIPQHVISMMDVAISNGDQLWGIMCFENRHSWHKWTLEDQSFARSLTDFVSLAFKSSQLNTAESALREKEYHYTNLVEQAQDAIMIIDADDNFLEVNDAACRISGYAKEELLAMQVGQILPKGRIEFYRKPNNDTVENKYLFGEQTIIRKDGTERTVEISARVFSDGRLQGIVRDVTERKLQDKALRESEARLDLALKGAEMGIWDFYIRENKMVHNKRWAEMLGYYFEDTVVTEEYWDKFIHPDDRDKAYANFDEHIKGKRPIYESEIRMLASDGQWRWILDKGRVVEWDAEGKPLRASGIHQDITAIKTYQQQILNQAGFMQQLVNAIPNLIYVKNAKNEFITVNNALAGFLGTTAEDLLQYPHGQQRNYSAVLNQLTACDSEVFLKKDIIITHEEEIPDVQTGRLIWLKSIKVPLIDHQGVLSEVLSVSMDVTALKQKENEISLLNDGLEIKVLERTNELEIANKELETFNYSVSHDLRTPLRSIDIFAYLLDKYNKETLDPEALENIRQIRSSVVKMSTLIDNLLIFSKMGRSDKRMDIVPVQKLVEEVLSELNKHADLSHYTILVRDLPVLTGDYDMLRQALMNLVSNAIKYTQTRKRPIIEFFSTSDEQAHTVAVRDNGVGFSAELKDKLFQAFRRLHSEEQFDGTGVGLAIVERIIKRHNGRVWAESEEGQGSTFYFSIPRG